MLCLAEGSWTMRLVLVSLGSGQCVGQHMHCTMCTRIQVVLKVYCAHRAEQAYD